MSHKAQSILLTTIVVLVTFGLFWNELTKHYILTLLGCLLVIPVMYKSISKSLNETY